MMWDMGYCIYILYTYICICIYIYIFIKIEAPKIGWFQIPQTTFFSAVWISLVAAMWGLLPDVARLHWQPLLSPGEKLCWWDIYGFIWGLYGLIMSIWYGVFHSHGMSWWIPFIAGLWDGWDGCSVKGTWGWPCTKWCTRQESKICKEGW